MKYEKIFKKAIDENEEVRPTDVFSLEKDFKTIKEFHDFITYHIHEVTQSYKNIVDAYSEARYNMTDGEKEMSKDEAEMAHMLLTDDNKDMINEIADELSKIDVREWSDAGLFLKNLASTIKNGSNM